MVRALVFIVHDCSLFRLGVRAALEANDCADVVGEAISYDAAAAQLSQCNANLVILNIDGHENSFRALQTTQRERPHTRYLAVTSTVHSPRTREAAEFGVHGFLSSHATADQLRAAVAAVNGGQWFVDPNVAGDLIEMIRAVPDERLMGCDERYISLTKQERTIFKLLALGKSNKEIAYELRLSRKTVETHHLHIMKKLAIHNPAELVRYAARIGIADLGP